MLCCLYNAMVVLVIWELRNLKGTSELFYTNHR